MALSVKNMLGGSNEGLFAWAKSVLVPKYIRNDGATYHDNGSESDKTKDSYIGNFSTKPTLYRADSYTFDELTGIFTLTNPTVVSYTTSSGDYFALYNGYGMFGSPSGTQMWSNTGSSSYNWVYNNGNDYWLLNRYSQSVTYKITSKIDSTKIIPFSKIVSNNENAFPSDGEQGGYYYNELTQTKFKTVVGSFTGAYGKTKYTIAHDGDMEVVGVHAYGGSSMGNYVSGFAVIRDPNTGKTYGAEASRNSNTDATGNYPQLTIIDRNTLTIQLVNYTGMNGSISYQVIGY